MSGEAQEPGVTGTDPETPCLICHQPLNPEIPPGMDASPFTRTVHPRCAGRRPAEYVAAGRPWRDLAEPAP